MPVPGRERRDAPPVVLQGQQRSVICERSQRPLVAARAAVNISASLLFLLAATSMSFSSWTATPSGMENEARGLIFFSRPGTDVLRAVRGFLQRDDRRTTRDGYSRSTAGGADLRPAHVASAVLERFRPEHTLGSPSGRQKARHARQRFGAQGLRRGSIVAQRAPCARVTALCPERPPRRRSVPRRPIARHRHAGAELKSSVRRFRLE